MANMKTIPPQQINKNWIGAYAVISRRELKKMLAMITSEECGDAECGIFEFRVSADCDNVVQVGWNGWGRDVRSDEYQLAGYPNTTKSPVLTDINGKPVKTRKGVA
jgi:hypothetical protein